MQPVFALLGVIVSLLLLVITNSMLFLLLAAIWSFVWGWQRAKIYHDNREMV